MTVEYLLQGHSRSILQRLNLCEQGSVSVARCMKSEPRSFRRLSREDLKSETIPGMVSDTCFRGSSRKVSRKHVACGSCCGSCVLGQPDANFQHYKRSRGSLHARSFRESVRGSWLEVTRTCGPRRLPEAPRAEANYHEDYIKKTAAQVGDLERLGASNS